MRNSLNLSVLAPLGCSHHREQYRYYGKLFIKIMSLPSGNISFRISFKKFEEFNSFSSKVAFEEQQTLFLEDNSKRNPTNKEIRLLEHCSLLATHLRHSKILCVN